MEIEQLRELMDEKSERFNKLSEEKKQIEVELVRLQGEYRLLQKMIDEQNIEPAVEPDEIINDEQEQNDAERSRRKSTK